MSARTIGLITVMNPPPGTWPGEWQIEVDGVRQTLVTAVNDAEGWCERYATDGNGHPVLPLGGGDFEREIVRGRVRLIYTGDDPRYSDFKETIT